MKFGSTTTIGRYIVDIDGALRSTDQAILSPREILALSGDKLSDAQVSWDLYDETIMLGTTDQVRLDEQTVTFFRTHARAHRFNDAALSAHRFQGRQAAANAGIAMAA